MRAHGSFQSLEFRIIVTQQPGENLFELLAKEGNLYTRDPGRLDVIETQKLWQCQVDEVWWCHRTPSLRALSNELMESVSSTWLIPISFQNISINLSLVVPVNSLVNVMYGITLERLKIIVFDKVLESFR